MTSYVEIKYVPSPEFRKPVPEISFHFQRFSQDVRSFSWIEKIAPGSTAMFCTVQLRPVVSVNFASYTPAGTSRITSRSSKSTRHPCHFDTGSDPNPTFRPGPDRIAKSYFWSNSRIVSVDVARRLRERWPLWQALTRGYGKTCSGEAPSHRFTCLSDRP